MIFLGTHPTLTQVPPISLFSIIATFLPNIAALLAAPKPPLPAPTTKKSYFYVEDIILNGDEYLCKRRPREDDSIPPSEDLHQVFPLEDQGIKKKKKRKFKPFCRSELMIALLSDQSYKDQYR
jgi:hypothetical protein